MCGTYTHTPREMNFGKFMAYATPASSGGEEEEEE